MSKELDRRGYKKEVLAELDEIAKEVERSDPVRQRCRVVSFVSRSAGRGRKRKPREVQLFVVDNTYAHCISHNEIKPRKRKDHIAIDNLAHEVLSDLPEDERTVDRLLERAR